MTTKITAHTDKQRALDLYKPPFRYSGGVIVDSEYKAVAMLAAINGIGELIADALNEYYANHKDKNENN